MIHDVTPQIAEAMLPMVRQYPTAPHPLQRYYYTSLKWMARHLESFVEPRSSRAAQALADEIGLGDLRQYRWLDQPSKMRDLGRRLFHWEHATQTSDLVKALLRLEEPTVEAIAVVLRSTTIAWITKKEDARLPLGERPDWQAAYDAAGIKLLPLPSIGEVP